MDIAGVGAVAASVEETLTLSTVAILAALYLLGGFVKGTAAFGQPLVVIPLSAFFVPIPTAIAISIGPIIVSNLVQLAQNRSAFPRVKRYWPFYLGIVAGMPLGFEVLVSASQDVLSLLVGTAILVFVMVRASGYRPQLGPSPNGRVLVGTGLASGVSAGATSFVSFPSLLVFTSYEIERREFALAAALMFLLSGVVLSGGLAALGVLGPAEFVTALICMAPSAAGQWLGQRLRDRLEERALLRAVYLLLAASASGLILRPLL